MLVEIRALYIEEKQRTFYLMNEDTGEIQKYDNFDNAVDLIKSERWVTLSGNFCDACMGVGNINGEECWHCFGEGIDPTK
jgi:hypothetical protein